MPGSAVETLREELRYDPEKARHAVQITISVLLVVIVMLAAQMPFVGIAPYMVFLLSQDEAVSTRAASLLGTIVTLVTCLMIVLIALIAFDAPWLRVPLFTLLFYGGFYLMRTFSQPKAALGALVVLGLVLVAFDKVPTSTYLFTQLAWLIAALGLVIAATLLGGWLTGIPTGRDRLRQSLANRMRATEQALRAPPAPNAKLRLTLLPGERTRVQESLERTILAGLLSPRQGDHYATIEQLWADLDEACDAFAQSADAPARERLANAVGALRRAILEERGLQAPELEALSEFERFPPSPTLGAAIHTVERAWSRIVDEKNTETEAEPPELVPADFGRNPLYSAFALRATLATMGCYLLMIATDWDGIHTCMVTTVATALATTGAQVRKQTLRISGALVGGLFGIVMVVMVIPRHESLLALLIILATGTFAAAWISLSSARISYAGWQIALAFFMTILQGPHPATSVDVIGDRWMGIAIGIVAMQLAFRIAWPETTLDALRAHLRRAREAIEKMGASSTRAGRTPLPTREIAARIVLAADTLEEAEAEAYLGNTDRAGLANARKELRDVRASFASAVS